MGARNAVVSIFVSSLALLTYLFGPVTVSADSFPLERTLRSVFRASVTIDGKPGACSMFSVSDQPPLYVTAAHCASGPVTFGALRFLPLEVDIDEDVAIFEGEGSLPPLTLGPAPKVGDLTMAIGYPGLSPKPIGIPTTYQGIFAAWGKPDEAPMAIFAGNTIPGMSGGPVINRRGEVVSVVLGGGKVGQTYQNVGFGAKPVVLRRMVLVWTANRGAR